MHNATTDGGGFTLTRYTQPPPRLPIVQIHLTLPAQPPPKISTAHGPLFTHAARWRPSRGDLPYEQLRCFRPREVTKLRQHRLLVVRNAPMLTGRTLDAATCEQAVTVFVAK